METCLLERVPLVTRVTRILKCVMHVELHSAWRATMYTTMYTRSMPDLGDPDARFIYQYVAPECALARVGLYPTVR